MWMRGLVSEVAQTSYGWDATERGVRVRSDLKNPNSDALFVIFAVLLTFIVK